mgnify:CR=1 FL=1
MKQLIERLVIFSICLLTAEYVYLRHMLLQYVTLIVLRSTYEVLLSVYLQYGITDHCHISLVTIMCCKLYRFCTF